MSRQIFTNLSAWDNTQMARHPNRPQTLDYVQLICDDFIELHGDRRFGDDPAIVAGVARVAGQAVMVIGHQKGRDVKERQLRNFGCAQAGRVSESHARDGIGRTPAGCRCSLLSIPRPRKRAWKRKSAASPRRSPPAMALMSQLRTPIVVIIIGEGGSGGAIGIAVGDYIAMLEHAIYSVIPPGRLRGHHGNLRPRRQPRP